MHVLLGAGGMPGMNGRGAGSRQDAPIEHALPCSLEEVYKGTTKRMKISRNVTGASGRSERVSETLTVDVKPGWKKGTRVTFPKKGKQLCGAASYCQPTCFVTWKRQLHPMAFPAEVWRLGRVRSARFPVASFQQLHPLQEWAEHFAGATDDHWPCAPWTEMPQHASR